MERLQKALNDSAELIENALLEYVRQYGNDYHADGDYTDEYGNECNVWYEDMDIAEEDESQRITKILDLYNWEGCIITDQHMINPGSEDDEYYIFETMAVYALYIVEYNGEEGLQYYCLYNSGAIYNDDESEPYHGPVGNMGITSLATLSATIIECDKH